MLRDQSVQIQLFILSLLHNIHHSYTYLVLLSPFLNLAMFRHGLLLNLSSLFFFLSAASTFELYFGQDLISKRNRREAQLQQRRELSRKAHPPI